MSVRRVYALCNKLTLDSNNRVDVVDDSGAKTVVTEIGTIAFGRDESDAGWNDGHFDDARTWVLLCVRSTSAEHQDHRHNHDEPMSHKKLLSNV